MIRNVKRSAAAATGVELSRFELLEEAARELVEPVAPPPPHVAPKEVVDPDAPKRLVLDAMDDGKNGLKFVVRLVNPNQWVGALAQGHKGATGEDLAKVRNFPEKKYREDTGWIIPATPPNVAHLLASWHPTQYIVTPAAALLLQVHLATVEVAEDHQRDRLRFLADGLTPNVDGFLSALPPYKHQIVAFSSARDAEYFALLCEMGVGKTKITIDVICDRARRARAKWEAEGSIGIAPQFRALIVAPTSVCSNWGREFAKHTILDANVIQLRGSQMARLSALNELAADLTTPLLVGVINYEGVGVLEAVAGDLFRNFGWDLMAADESIKIKNPDTKRSKAIYRVGAYAASRFILTGLPITKNVEDLYGQFHFLKPGSLGYDSHHAFRNYYSEAGYFGGSGSYRKEKLPELQERLSRFSFSIRLNQCVDLPPKTYQTLDVEMGDEQASAYEKMANDLIVDLEHLGATPGDTLNTPADVAAELHALAGERSEKFSVASIVLVQLLRLQQITSGYLKLSDGTIHRFNPNPKLDAIEEYMEEIDDNDKVIVWSNFREDLEQVQARFEKKYGVALFYGGLSAQAKDNAIARFTQSPTCRIFAGNQQSGGFGINLVGATHALYLSNPYSLQERYQSEARNHRIGTTRTVLYSDIVVPNSIDQIVLDRIKAKKDLSDLLTDKQEILKTLRAQLGARGASL